MPEQANKVRMDKDLAEAQQFLANAHKADAEAALVGLQLRDLELHLASTQRDEQSYELNSKKYRTIYLIGQVTEELMFNNILLIRRWVHLAEVADEEPGVIEVMVYGPGGDAFAGMALFDEIAACRAKGWTFNGYLRGWAASMSGILLQACTNRYAGPESWLLIHEPTMSSAGKASEMEDNALWMKRISERIINIFIDRSKGKVTRANFVKKYNRRDWTLNATEALESGFIDEIR